MATKTTKRWKDTYSSSILGWKIRFTKPILGLLYGYWSGNSTWIFHRPPANGAFFDQLGIGPGLAVMLTLFWSFEPYVELLPGHFSNQDYAVHVLYRERRLTNTVQTCQSAVGEEYRCRPVSSAEPSQLTVVVDKCHFVVTHQPCVHC